MPDRMLLDAGNLEMKKLNQVLLLMGLMEWGSQTAKKHTHVAYGIRMRPTKQTTAEEGWDMGGALWDRVVWEAYLRR